MQDIFFNDIWRMDWGLGNPNKTAALIAELMVAVWGLAYLRKWGFWVAFGIFIVLEGCLIHTFSRGGLLAAFIGLMPLLVFIPRHWPLRYYIAIGFSVLGIIAFSFCSGAYKRYSQGLIREDSSITNRILLWKVTPAMMVDAPKGWGIGNSGKAFMRWYQPTQRYEQYRTLVNSHLSWLVEVGWPLRYLYLFAWLTVFLLCLPTKEVLWHAIPSGIWLAFGAASFFSSIAESPFLWILPILSLAMVLGVRLRRMQWPRPVAWIVPAGIAFFLCLTFLILGNGGQGITGSKDRVIVGKNLPLVWLVVDERILGSYGFAKSLRNYLAEHPTNQSIGIVESLASLPNDLSGANVIISGLPDGWNKEKMRQLVSSVFRLILLSPAYYPQESGIDFNTKNSIKVLFGEFSQSAYLMAWKETGKVHRIAGVGDFFPTWPQIIFEEAKP